MAHRDTTLRHLAIINRLKQSPATLDEISDYLSRDSETKDFNNRFSRRTFFRAKEAIFSLHHIDIKFNKKDQKYFIEEDDEVGTVNTRLTDALNTIQALNLASGTELVVFLENRKSTGIENFEPIFKAIQDNKVISFSYQKFINDDISQRVVEPIALKEFEHRWYLIASDKKDDSLKSFGLDRITKLEVNSKKSKFKNAKQIASIYENVFGITKPVDDVESENIVLKFSPIMAPYIKNLPLHSSQKVVSENKKDGIEIELNLFINNDLINELLKYGKDVIVKKPAKLKKKLLEIYKAAIKNYN